MILAEYASSVCHALVYSIWCIPFFTLCEISCCFSVSKILFRHLYLGSERIFSRFHVEPAFLVILWKSPKRGTSYDVYHTSYEVHYTSYDVYPCRCIHHMRYTIHHMIYTYIDVYPPSYEVSYGGMNQYLLY